METNNPVTPDTTTPQAPPAQPPPVSGRGAPPQENQKKPLVKPLVSEKTKKKSIYMVLASFLVVVLGVTTGWFLAGTRNEGKTSEGGSTQTTNSKGEVERAGVGEEGDYDSTAEGVLKSGGVNGEGTHHLDRGLGEGKYVSLTSSVVDLDSFLDKEVVVWGETISVDPKLASWKIDVGLVTEVK